VLENVLTKEDTLIVIIEDEPNDTIVEHMKYLYHRDEIFVVIHNMKRLQFNMLNHSLVPKMTILTEAEETEFMNTYKITDKTKIPRFLPTQALCVFARIKYVGLRGTV
jgi:DNA-directed RNA polymerase subunit H (RpoH/RPB5)